MIKISVIVPVYNVENYLEKCLLSLQNQTLKDIEIIILNDGSSDKSSVIAKRFCENDERFKYYTHKNRGLGPTRNRGIELAKGEYLSFVDSDDYIANYMCEKMYNIAKRTNADIVCGEIVAVYDEKRIAISNLDNLDTINLKEIGLQNFLKNFFFKNLYTTYVCDKIFRTDLIKEHTLTFGDNNKIFGEDLYLHLRLFKVANVISFVSETVYFYLQREDSIMNSYKPNLMERQLQMSFHYGDIAIDETEKMLQTLLTFDSIIMEIVNIKKTYGKGFRDYRKSMNKVRLDAFYSEQLKELVKLESYRLYSSFSKRRFVEIVSKLEIKNFFLLSDILVYTIYSVRNLEIIR